MENNRLLPPGQRKEIEERLRNHNLDASDFTWEELPSEGHLETAKRAAIKIPSRSALNERMRRQPNVSRIVHNQTQAFFLSTA